MLKLHVTNYDLVDRKLIGFRRKTLHVYLLLISDTKKKYLKPNDIYPSGQAIKYVRQRSFLSIKRALIYDITDLS